MARDKNGKVEKLDEALTALVAAQALLVQNQAGFQAEIRAIGERFDRLERYLLDHSHVLAEHGRILNEHGRILAEHGRILQALPDAIRDKIGFRAT